MKISSLITLIILLTTSYSLTAQTKTMVKIDSEGEVISGSIEKLISKIQDGHKVRVGWTMDSNRDGEIDLEHWIDAEFISIIGGHVFTQIQAIYRQVPKQDPAQIDIIPSDLKWTGVVGTNGLLRNRYIFSAEIEYETDENGQPIMTEAVEKALQKREVRTWKVATTWVVLGY